MKKAFSTLIIICLFAQGFSQTDHWEMVVESTDSWKYFVGTEDPGSDWTTLSFNDENWQEGVGGIGYGNPECSTIIPEGIASVFVRKAITIDNIDNITIGQINIRFDDGFVAYLNGTEIARDNMDGYPPLWDQLSIDYQEEGTILHPFAIDSTLLHSLLVTGENMLSIEVHNQSTSSSDLFCFPYLFLGFNDSEIHFEPAPEWFIPLGGNGNNSTPSTSYELESNIPIIVVNTQGQNIPDEPKVTAFMGIIHNENSINSTDQPYNHFDGRIGIELRGSSSLYFPKKSYGLETWTETNADTSISIFNMPEEEDWILQGPYTDKALLRNVLAYHLSNEMGMYAPRTQLCELIVNDEYLGVYAFMEKIKRDNGRVGIAKLTPEENSGEDLTGGYIMKIDKPRGDPGFDSEYEAMGDYYNPDYPIRFLYDYPKADNITEEQKAYIENYVKDFEDALAGDDFMDSDIGYRKYIDVDSFIDFMILNEVSKNIDGYRISTFFHKDKNEKIKMGPVWDFNFAFGMQKWYNSYSPEGWNFKMYEYWTWEDYQFPFWWERLLEDPYYINKLGIRWEQLRENVLSNETVSEYIIEQVDILDDAQARNFERWPIIGVDIDPNYYTFNSYEEETDYLIDWVSERMDWIDENIVEYYNGIENNKINHNSTVYPNPFTSNFFIQFNLDKTSNIEISVMDAYNARTISFYKEIYDVGNHTISLDEISTSKNALKPGIYFIEVKIDNIKTIHKIIKT